jgi:hypothetical protein
MRTCSKINSCSNGFAGRSQGLGGAGHHDHIRAQNATAGQELIDRRVYALIKQGNTAAPATQGSGGESKWKILSMAALGLKASF